MSGDALEVVAVDGRVGRRSELRLVDFWTAFSFGAGLFETILVSAGTPMFLPAHLARLRASLARHPAVRPPAAAVLADGEVARSVAACLVAEGGPGPSWTGALRLVAADGHLLATFRSYEPPAGPVDLATADRSTYRRGDDTLAHKATSYLRQYRHGATPVVFVNERGQLCETANGNLVFQRRDGSLVTPPVAAPCLPGVVRGVLLGLGSAAGWPALVEADVAADDLADIVGAAVTSSLQLATPVAALLGHPLPASADLAARLRAAILAAAEPQAASPSTSSRSPA